MTTSRLPAPPAQASDASARAGGANWQGFRSLSRAMFRGFIRDRAALFFSILFPVLFLLLFGSIYKSSSTPKITIVEVGKVGLLDQARAASHQLNQVLDVTQRASLATALNDVRQGNVRRSRPAAGGPDHRSLLGRQSHHRRGGHQRVLRHRAAGEPGGIPPAAHLPAGHPAGGGQVAQADPVPDAGPARLGDRLRRRVRGSAHPGRLAEEQAAAPAPARPDRHDVHRHRPDRGEHRGRDRRKRSCSSPSPSPPISVSSSPPTGGWRSRWSSAARSPSCPLGCWWGRSPSPRRPRPRW